MCKIALFQGTLKYGLSVAIVKRAFKKLNLSFLIYLQKIQLLTKL